MLSSNLVENEIFVKHSSGDADYLIALIAIEKVKNNNIVCITDDTDILVFYSIMLRELHSIFIWRRQVAMPHASEGKTVLLSRLHQIRNLTEYFYEENAVASQIADMGEKVMLVLYGNKDYQTLDDLRKFHYNLKVATSKNVVQAKALPPTSNAAVQHSYRVYQQVQVWLGNEKTRYSGDGI